jgi:hypothetical protein
MAIQWVAAAAIFTSNMTVMEKALLKFRKWAIVLGATPILWLAACKGDGDLVEQVDFEAPLLTLMSPVEGQVFSNGDTIRITGTVTDNKELQTYFWSIMDTANVLIPDTIAYPLENTEDTVMATYIVSGVSAIALWKLTVHVDDASKNFDNEIRYFIVSQ